jgi:sulfite reductase alpha subunit-like flavoprotein
MELEADATVEVQEPGEDAPPLPPGLSAGQVLPVSTLLKRHLDIRGQPTRYLFELLANFTPSEMEVRAM